MSNYIQLGYGDITAIAALGGCSNRYSNGGAPDRTNLDVAAPTASVCSSPRRG